MFHPVGPQPPSVYWRRRLLLIGSTVLLIVLLAVTIQAVTSSGGSGSQAGGTTAPPPASTTPTVAPTSKPPSTSKAPTSSKASSTSATSTKSSSSPSTPASSAPPTPATCKTSDLAVAAVVAKSSYQVGDTPMLELQVTNTGAAPCVQDLADKQIVLKVYNGESRVWGSHDCETQAGTSLRTLAVRTSVRVTITWSGLTSQPNACKTRQRVGAGTYTLYATLSGKTGTATQFTMS